MFETCEECDFMVHKTASITNFTGAVTYLFDTCEECDFMVHKNGFGHTFPRSCAIYVRNV